MLFSSGNQRDFERGINAYRIAGLKKTLVARVGGHERLNCSCGQYDGDKAMQLCILRTFVRVSIFITSLHPNENQGC